MFLEMSDLKFEGNLDGVSESQLKYIGSVLEERGYKNEKVLFEAVGKAGDNYGSNVKRIIVEKDGVTFKMIAKIAPNMEGLRNSFNIAVLFRNEHYMYTEVLPKFNDMLKSAEVPEEDLLRYAACYGTKTEEPNEVILLEDLLLSDFTMLDKFKVFTSDTVKLVLKNFAILHSLSYALKHQEPETYQDFKSKLVNVWVPNNGGEGMHMYFDQFEEDLLTILDDEKYKKRVKGSVSQLGELFLKNSKFNDASRFSVIEQGDSWINNIMFRLEGDKSVQCCMIDYQVSRTGSPVNDILYMIFNCTDYETRSKHFHEWIDYYHSQLDTCLANFGLKANYVYPRDQLDADLKRYGKTSFAISLFLAGLMFKESTDASKMKEVMEKGGTVKDMMDSSKVSLMNEASVLRYKTRIEGLIDSFLDLGYF